MTGWCKKSASSAMLENDHEEPKTAWRAAASLQLSGPPTETAVERFDWAVRPRAGRSKLEKAGNLCLRTSLARTIGAYQKSDLIEIQAERGKSLEPFYFDSL